MAPIDPVNNKCSEQFVKSAATSTRDGVATAVITVGGATALGCAVGAFVGAAPGCAVLGRLAFGYSTAALTRLAPYAVAAATGKALVDEVSNKNAAPCSLARSAGAVLPSLVLRNFPRFPTTQTGTIEMAKVGNVLTNGTTHLIYSPKPPVLSPSFRGGELIMSAVGATREAVQSKNANEIRPAQSAHSEELARARAVDLSLGRRMGPRFFPEEARERPSIARTRLADEQAYFLEAVQHIVLSIRDQVARNATRKGGSSISGALSRAADDLFRSSLGQSNAGALIASSALESYAGFTSRQTAVAWLEKHVVKACRRESSGMDLLSRILSVFVTLQTHLYGFTIVTPGSVSQMKSFIGQDRALDLGAGNGFLTKVLTDAGIAVDGVDVDPDYYALTNYRWNLKHAPVARREVSRDDPTRYKVLILASPEPGAAYPLDAIKLGFQKVIFIKGKYEDSTGPNATRFFDELYRRYKEQEFPPLDLPQDSGRSFTEPMFFVKK